MWYLKLLHVILYITTHAVNNISLYVHIYAKPHIQVHTLTVHLPLTPPPLVGVHFRLLIHK